MPVVKVNTDLCQGYGNCIPGAEDVFDIDDDGLVVALRREIDEADRDRVEEAVARCPVAAVWLEQ